MKMPKPKTGATLYLAVAIVLGLAGVGGFILLFAKDYNIYWLILSPVIITLYELPAVYVFRLYRKSRTAAEQRGEAGEQAQGPDRS